MATGHPEHNQRSRGTVEAHHLYISFGSLNHPSSTCSEPDISARFVPEYEVSVTKGLQSDIKAARNTSQRSWGLQMAIFWCVIRTVGVTGGIGG